MEKSNKLNSLEHLFVREQILTGLAKENFFLLNKINKYVSFAKKSEEGRQVFMKLIRHMGSEQPKKEFMKFIANTVYEERALVEEKEEQLFLLEKMVEFEEGETDREEFGQRHRIECYILIILSRLCQADARNFHQLPQIMQAQGYSPLRFQKLIGQLVHNIRPVIVASDKQVWVGILMLLAVVVGVRRRRTSLTVYGMHSLEKDS